MSALHPAGTLAAVERAAEMLGSLVERNRPIGELTTYRVGGVAALYCESADIAELERVSQVVGATGIDVLVLGKGSNVLVADSGFKGLCLRLGAGFSHTDIEGEIVRAGGGTAYPVLARRTASAGLTGLEWAVGVPGSVGGAVRMNAGGHGAETSDRLLSCRVVTMGSTTARVVTAFDLDLSYRHSSLLSHEVVTEASFRLEQGEPAVSAGRIAEIVRWRREHQPGGQNAGSVFTNPADDTAGRLVEQAGLKGMRIGTAVVSEKHANFIQADPEGSADDVKRLIDMVQRLVVERLGVELRTELHMVGFEEES
jgi:UDP-N-acetylmuramate dehydrogenase